MPIDRSKRRILVCVVLIALAAIGGGAYLLYHWYYLPSELRVAATKGDLGRVEQLLTAGADVHRPLGLASNSVLNRAVESGNPAVVKAVLAAGADPNAKGETGMTALMHAAFLGKPEVIEVLLDYGANPSVVEDRRKDTALLLAVARGNTEAVRVLAKAKTNVNQGSEWGRSPLCEAMSRGLHEIEKTLSEAGAKCAMIRHSK